ncbi:beta-ketoacyl synthase chain length factor [Thiomicrorhabdus sp. ZW0627]|uniref:beta-ketoacyl synthase chain length factor n=1 Tax=Thiomicrorhabdus sp. ZW0627 TaxID=3039774 RepID=UPI002436F458|nr:beta-ketoacyl synthase chain length factor [Thiomicrorhabdus sp. ZW0627]MDG6774332.1 beta-ketoacyl synthase chain length factor [Thiomicrorhabdus sp. ZW0627]
MIAYIESIGLQAPGLESWQASQEVLQDKQPYQSEPLSKYSPKFLPANERRRTTDTIKLALRTAEEAVENYSEEQISQMPTLFACVDGDTTISAKMVEAVMEEEPMISPIHFHNSVHNAPAGYWMIGQHNQQAASAISAGDYQIANTLIEAITQLSNAHPKVLLVIYDLPINPEIKKHSPEVQAFACALVLSLQPTADSIAEIELTLSDKIYKIDPVEAFPENKAAEFLPVLKSIAKREAGEFHFPLSAKQAISLNLTPSSQ